MAKEYLSPRSRASAPRSGRSLARHEVIRAARLLPKTKKREYYEADLSGLPRAMPTAKICGTVLAVHNYGAGPFLEIGRAGEKKDSFMLPFTEACVPEVDIKAQRVTLRIPDGWLET